MASFVLWSGEPGRGEDGRGERREGTNRDERPASLIEHRPSASSASSASFSMPSTVASRSTAQHATTATTSPEHHAPCAPVLPEPLQFAPPLQPPSRELQIAMPLMAQVQASIMYSDTLCMSIAYSYLAAKYSIPLLSFEARAASHRGSTLSSVWDLFEDLGDL
ncbi:hypothetical protein THAR02_07782 [Trichoderma harzianum]|uniref:Uncharacterized protein n=1 Tax=Trichoderma harzianum TaxID=5544 RepID=A0A0F9X4I3_TRIHA|nr:hypothetical protein THAR02_07782 [Trichoderma harzianum]